MDRHDFISRIISMYPHIIKDEGVNSYYDAYKRNLKNPNIDYEKLFDIFATEYKSKYPPEGATIGEMANRCLKEEVVKTSKWVHVKIFNPIYKCVTDTDCAPSDWSEEKILNWYKKRFNCDGWRIVELRHAQ